MLDFLDFTDTPDEDGGEPRRGPLWRHALWVAALTGLAVLGGFTMSAFRLGPEEFGIPKLAPGPVLPLLAVCAATGLAAGTVLRATAARIALYAPGRVLLILVVIGTRLALGFRPGTPLLAAGAAAVVAAAAAWCAYGAWTHRGTAPAAGG
ncbi:hypothetical protein [Streptomyces sp. NPDC089799]|uniref:hypothetical protein n=1 Tax=Streptomyces sp. NPDC089799 TaxID=3155066 RepID=UPI00344A09A3